MQVRKLETFQELDAILPLIEKLHKSTEYCKLFPHSAYLMWLTLNFRLPNMAVWGVYPEIGDTPVGYAIAVVQDLHSTGEALMYEAYSEFSEVESKKLVIKLAKAWARERGCKLLSMYTESPEVARICSERYGFSLKRFYLTQEV